IRKTGLAGATEAHVEMSTILLVDDEPAVLNLCQQILKLGGYNVLPASSGQEALRLCQSSNTVIHLFLLDIVMPGMNGIELAQRLQSMNPSARVVLMSGYAHEEIASLICGDSYRIIWKPFRAGSLLRMIENVLDTPI